MTTKHDHLAEATVEIVTRLRTFSVNLRAEEPDTLKRWLLACELCREAGADFSGQWDTEPSPLQQVVQSMSEAVSYAVFDHAAGTLTLSPDGARGCSVLIPLDWFDEALLMVDSQFGSPSYPYQAPARLELVK